ncbi:ubiquitin carboxyl-terminal hydrolase 36 isoform X21 [Dermacentor silvarum]|uniref:ubiquitin carboxyl-terminal hydrolase 36 isoform X19 n=1 Tax=Dermacentor silvarum TaxID=543639 RepID=UPI0021017ED0|nr:ubiquitin carboxyl-terminal hydrolase 36 isoform X19 [Dermacentor silvarum]XP_049523699.1 ubiquitin carboxyl-terminal hydrolase 36 isoform X20 [Dermacentor silvarum]XP_049523700.1 ubiquitin carboxyl-terminal hydrolase 36 isoform X21 [Dermacentor silvarum]
MPQESLKMISNSISLGLGRSPLGLNQQVAGGSRSSVLLSRIDFEPCDGGGKLSTEALRAKYAPLSPSPVHNGQLSKNNSLHKLGGKSMVNGASMTNGVGGGGDAMNGGVNKVARRDDGGEDGIPEPRVRLHSSDAIWLDWREQRRIGAGLVNMGNTCFMNTVIQCLTYCPPLANYLLHQDDHCTKCKTMNFCMMCELQRHMKRALEKSGDTIKPLYIYQRLKAIAKHFQFGQQEDAHEFLRYVVDNLWKAALANYEGGLKLDPASKETTVVNEIFGGYHRSQVICMKCKEKSNTYDHFMDLILDIKNASSLETALEKFVEPELLQNDNAYKCPRCNIKVMAQKRFTVHRAPNVATFQFKRFDANRMFGGKITKHVSYPEHLELRPYMSDKHGDPVTYRLNAVLVHLGASCNSGHYFCFVRNSNGNWYCMDDSRVHQVSLGQVLNQQAYVLFYVRTPPESQENHIVKKSNSAAALCSRNATPEPLRNGQLSTVHQWDARPNMNGSKDGSSSSYWNGSNGAKKQTDIVGYLQNNGSRQYGFAVNGWGRGSGGGYHNSYGSDRGGGNFYRDKRKYYDDYDSYDDEYDKGKQKRKSNGFNPHSGSHYRNGSNPFQQTQNFRNQQGGGHRFHNQQFQRFQKGPPPFYARHHNRQHSNYGPPRRKHHYSRTR